SLPKFLALVSLNDACGRIPRIVVPMAIVITSVQRRGTQITGIDLNWHVGTVAQLASNRHATDIGAEAHTVQPDVFGMLKEIACCASATVIARHDSGLSCGCCRLSPLGQLLSESQITGLSSSCSCLSQRGCSTSINSKIAANVGVEGVTAMVVHSVKTKLGVVQRWSEPTERNTKLAAVASLFILAATNNIGSCIHAPLIQPWVTMGVVLTCVYQTIITPTRRHVSSREERTAVIRNSAVPLELVEGFHTQVLGQTLGDVEHLDRQQTFLQLGAGTAESGSIDGVDGVDAVLDEDALTPADHLATQPDVTGVLANGVVVVDKGVQQLDTGAFLQRVAAGIADVVEFL